MKFYEHPSYDGIANELPENDARIPQFEKDYNERGFDDTVTWSLDWSIAKFILPRLKIYMEIAPEVIKIEPDFQKAMEEMIEGFEIAVEDCATLDKEKISKEQKAWDNLAKWHRGLWW